MSLTGESTELSPQRLRADGASVNRRFNRAIKDNGGSGEVYQDAAVAETEELFGCSVNDLYQTTGGKRGRRDTLPEIVQHTYMHNEISCSRDLERQVGSIGGESQEEVNGKIVGRIRSKSRQNRDELEW